MEIHVVLHPDEIAQLPNRLDLGACCVVFDILRATTSMVTAFEHGAQAIRPVDTVDEARALAADDPALRLVGERHGFPPEGFDWGNSPADFRQATGLKLVMTTTNGTRAIVQSAQAGAVWIGAFRNLEAVAKQVAAWRDGSVYLIAAGTGPNVGLEDLFAAGALCERLGVSDQNDSTRLATAAWQTTADNLSNALRQTDNGRTLIRNRLAADIDWAAQRDTTRVVPRCQAGWISLCAAETPSL